jgi:hypothetical protein
MKDYPVTFAGDGVKELQSTDGLIELAPRGVQFINHPKLEISNLFRSKFFWMFSKPHGESIDVIRVSVNGSRREISKLHVLGHAFGEGGDASVVGSHKAFPILKQKTE